MVRGAPPGLQNTVVAADLEETAAFVCRQPIMGWRERDYAKWTDEERRLYLGSGVGLSRAGRDPFLGGHGGKYTARPERFARIRLNNGVGLAILISWALFLLGEFRIR